MTGAGDKLVMHEKVIFGQYKQYFTFHKIQHEIEDAILIDDHGSRTQLNLHNKIIGQSIQIAHYQYLSDNQISVQCSGGRGVAETVAGGGGGGGRMVWRFLLFSLLRKMMKPSSFKLVVKIPSYTPYNCLNEDDVTKRIRVPQSILWDAFS